MRTHRCLTLRWQRGAAAEWSGGGELAASGEFIDARSIASGFEDRFAPLDKSHRLDGKEGSIVAIPTERGGVCAEAQSSGAPLTAFCAPDLNDNGTMIVSVREPNAHSTLVGVVADDVTSIRAELDNGDVVEVPVSGGFVLWAPSGGAVVEAITTTRSGTDQAFRQAFVPQT